MAEASDALDRAMRKLRRPNGIEDRLAALGLLIEYWHGPIGPGDGMTSADLAGFGLPEPLRWWYGFAGRRTDIMSGQNQLLLPTNSRHPYWQLQTEDDKLLFYLENQACYRWSTLTAGEDPPVFGRENETDRWEEENVSLSEHLFLACMFEAVINAPFGASSCDLTEEKFAVIEAHMPEVPIGPWRWCNFRFYAGPACMMVANILGHAEGRRFYGPFIGARTGDALDFLKPLLGPEWDYARLD